MLSFSNIQVKNDKLFKFNIFEISSVENTKLINLMIENSKFDYPIFSFKKENLNITIEDIVIKKC